MKTSNNWSRIFQRSLRGKRVSRRRKFFLEEFWPLSVFVILKIRFSKYILMFLEFTITEISNNHKILQPYPHMMTLRPPSLSPICSSKPLQYNNYGWDIHLILTIQTSSPGLKSTDHQTTLKLYHFQEPG